MSHPKITKEQIENYKKSLPLAFGLPIKEKRKQLFVILIFLGFTVFTLFYLDFRPFQGLDKLGWLLPEMFPPTPHNWLLEFLYAMGETLAIAFLGTFLGFLFALPLSFLAAKNIVKNALLRNIIRRFFDVIRGINTIIWALMFVHVVGLGPFAGILAFLVSDMATLGKLFSEAIENIDMKEIEGIRSTGANSIQVIRYGYFPQVFPVFLSNGLYFLESNIRAASIIGMLGAGGIGMQLWDRIRTDKWDEAAFIIIMILVTVAIIDLVSKRLREKIIANPRLEQ